MKGSGGTRNVDKTHKGGMSPEQAYYEYTHGGGAYNESSLYAMDALFKPATKDIELHRGTSTVELDAIMRDNGIKDTDYWELEDRTLNMKHYESTTLNERYAQDYAADAGEYGNGTPVVLHLDVKKGTPIVKRSEHTDTKGRAANSEYTIGRNVKWKVTSVYENSDDFGNDVIDVYVDVLPKKKK